MAYFYGYGKQNKQHGVGSTADLEKKMADLEKKFNSLGGYKTVFEINLKTAKKTTDGDKCLEARNGKYVLSQPVKNLACTFGSDYVENTSKNYMVFICPELQFGNISIFTVSETSDTDGYGTWRYIIGNDDGGFDKFIGYKVLSYDKIIHGGGDVARKYINTLPTFSVMGKKILLSGHWQQINSCIYYNGVKVTGSGFTADIKHIGNPFGSIFFNERFLSGHTSSNNTDKMIGKIYGIKIVQGFLTGPDIVKIHTEMIKEYSVVI